MPHPHQLPPGGGRFTLTALAGPPPAVRKTGDPGALAHEALALRALAGVGGVPELLRSQPGVLVQSRLPGAPCDLAALAPPRLERLGALLRTVHDHMIAPVAGLPGWGRGERDPGRYARRRTREVIAAASAVGHRLRLPVPEASAPYRLLHGDLTQDNVVWGPHPGLVDWEFWHRGDPAEDLAYLWVLNDLGTPVMEAVARGYDDADALERARGWRPVVAAESAVWWTRLGETRAAERLWDVVGSR